MSYTPLNEEQMHNLLNTTRTIALVGASAKVNRASNEVMGYLIDLGFELWPVNPGMAGKELMGRPVHASLADIPVPIDMVDVFREQSALPGITDEAISIGAKSLWFQLGLRDDEACARAQAAGMTVVMDDCPKMAVPRTGWHPQSTDNSEKN